jgi:hypothetical protein
MKSFANLTLVLLAGAAAMQAQQVPTTKTVCTLEDMHGDFATQPIGILTAGPFAGPFAATGVIHFDGKGGFTGIATSSFFGHVIYPFHADGIYNITPDCFFSLVEETLHIGFIGYLSTTKNEVQMMEPDASSITTNTLRRLVNLTCTDGSLSGNWVLNGSGTQITNGDHVAQLKRINFDGKGNTIGTLHTSIQGVIGQTTLVGTYTMNSDCTFLGRETDALGNVYHWFGVIFNNGEQMIYNYSDDGQVFAGQGRTSLN